MLQLEQSIDLQRGTELKQIGCWLESHSTWTT